MSNPLLESASQTQCERLFHIDFRLYFLGTVNRSDLVSRFGIKVIENLILAPGYSMLA